MNSTPPTIDRPAYAKLAFAPLGLLLCVAPLHAAATASGPSSTALAVDLLALAVGALLGWLGGDLTPPREAPMGRPRPRLRWPRPLLSRRAA
ncbi:MAG: hypothetical protein JWM10_4372 [Myxococcaceae bacterium]|nr:hypothetical protein [Myxococcaceae bacterium]